MGQHWTWRARPVEPGPTVVVDIDVNKKTGKVVVKHMYGAQDSGLLINPGALQHHNEVQRPVAVIGVDAAGERRDPGADAPFRDHQLEPLGHAVHNSRH